MDGALNISNNENVAKKFKAMGWNVVQCKNGNSYKHCSRAIAKAKKMDGPTIIIFHTTIGIGTNKEGTSAIHGVALSEEELKVFNKKLGVFENFFVPNDVRDWCMSSSRRGKLEHEKWNQDLAVYANSNPELYRQFLNFFDRKKVDIEKMARSSYKWEGLSGRDFNKEILNEVSDKLYQMVGGTADVSHSTGAIITNGGNYNKGNRRGRNIRFGVREHAMAAICNGISLYEDFIPFCSTFLAFSDYMHPSIRLAAMMKLNVVYFLTHDSILIGEDGVTHQPIEQLGALRSIIGLNVIRPCDANELLAGYQYALENKGPVAFVLSRQKMPPVDGSYKNALLGGYIIRSAKKDADIVIYATGSEVSLALSVAEELSKKCDVSVVSIPCFEVFEKQSASYKNKVLQKSASLRVAIEASNDTIWNKYLREDDILIAVNEYQGSGNGNDIYSKAGFNVKEIVKKVSKRI